VKLTPKGEALLILGLSHVISSTDPAEVNNEVTELLLSEEYIDVEDDFLLLVRLILGVVTLKGE
jgi:hypothetical protein